MFAADKLPTMRRSWLLLALVLLLGVATVAEAKKEKAAPAKPAAGADAEADADLEVAEDGEDGEEEEDEEEEDEEGKAKKPLYDEDDDVTDLDAKGMDMVNADKHTWMVSVCMPGHHQCETAAEAKVCCAV